MKKKAKLNLENLKVQSFVTVIDRDSKLQGAGIFTLTQVPKTYRMQAAGFSCGMEKVEEL